MQSGMKIVTVVIAVALIVVIGLIVMFSLDTKDVQSAANTGAAATQDAAVTGNEANDAANAEENKAPGDADTQAQSDEAQDEPMYEGALAGMTEEEIAKLALAEEQNHDEGESND